MRNDLILICRAVERIYSDHGPSMAEYIRKNPAVAIPVAFSRLQQKDKEWRATRANMNKLWRKVKFKTAVLGTVRTFLHHCG